MTRSGLGLLDEKKDTISAGNVNEATNKGGFFSFWFNQRIVISSPREKKWSQCWWLAYALLMNNNQDTMCFLPSMSGTNERVTRRQNMSCVQGLCNRRYVTMLCSSGSACLMDQKPCKILQHPACDLVILDCHPTRPGGDFLWLTSRCLVFHLGHLGLNPVRYIFIGNGFETNLWRFIAWHCTYSI